MEVGNLKGKALIETMGKIKRANSEVRVHMGEENYSHIRVGEVLPSQIVLYAQVPPPLRRGFIRGYVNHERFFYKFESDLTGYDYTRIKGDSIYRWIIIIPELLLKVVDRHQRILPGSSVHVQRSPYNELAVQYFMEQTRNDISRFKVIKSLSDILEAEKSDVRKIDETVYREIYTLAGLDPKGDLGEIKKYIGIQALTEKGRAVISKDEDTQLFIEDTQADTVAEKSREIYKARNVGSLSVVGITTYNGGLEAIVKCATTLSGGKHLTHQDFRYVKALAACAQAARNKILPKRRYEINDISENGMALETTEFKNLPEDHRIGMFQVHLGQISGRDHVTVSLRHIRDRKDGVAVRIDYLGDEGKNNLRYIRQYISKELEAGAKTV